MAKSEKAKWRKAKWRNGEKRNNEKISSEVAKIRDAGYSIYEAQSTINIGK
jgi:hypothetical protein